MFTITFTDAELYELGDAISPAFQQLISEGDPQNYEAKYGSATNLLSIIRKSAQARWGDDLPTWLPQMEADLAALRAKKLGDPKAAADVAQFKASEAMLVNTGKFKVDNLADNDGIRTFNVGRKQ